MGAAETCSAKEKDVYAYAAFSNADFGILNLVTGQFVPCGNTGGSGAVGLAVGPGNTLYAETTTAYPDIYTINPTNAATTYVGPTGIPNPNYALGSTLTAIYDVDTAGNVYTINPTSGAATRIGTTGVPASSFANSLSANSKKLYYNNSYGLYTLSTKKGKASLIGDGTTAIDADVYIGKTLYGGSVAPPAIYTINTSTGATTFVANVSGESASVEFYGLVPAPATAANGRSL